MASMEYLLRLDGTGIDLAEVRSSTPLEIGDLVRIERGAVYEIRHLNQPDPGQTLAVASLFRVWDGIPPSPLGSAREPKVVHLSATGP
jgi:hypothetical protein